MVELLQSFVKLNSPGSYNFFTSIRRTQEESSPYPCASSGHTAWWPGAKDRGLTQLLVTLGLRHDVDHLSVVLPRSVLHGPVSQLWGNSSS